jgi:hypothetical protein
METTQALPKGATGDNARTLRERQHQKHETLRGFTRRAYARREPVEVATTVKIPFRACSTGNLPTRCRSVNTISGPRTNSRVALIRLNNRAP